MEATTIKTCLNSYCAWSGQKLNDGKSSILNSKNIVASSINNIKGIIPYKPTSSASYCLGLPFIIGKSKKEAFQPILDKVLSKINGWRAKTLSQAGRTVLIKAIASAIPTYAMSTFVLPTSICKALDRNFKNFWWGFPAGKSRNLSLKSWKSIAFPATWEDWEFEVWKPSTWRQLPNWVEIAQPFRYYVGESIAAEVYTLW